MYFCPLKSAEGAPYADFFFAELLFRISLGRPSFNERKFPFHAVVTTKRMSNVISRGGGSYFICFQIWELSFIALFKWIFIRKFDINLDRLLLITFLIDYLISIIFSVFRIPHFE